MSWINNTLPIVYFLERKIRRLSIIERLVHIHIAYSTDQNCFVWQVNIR